MNGESLGFTFLSALLVVVLVSIALCSIHPLISTVIRREDEEELLFRLGEIRDGIGIYYKTYKKYPDKLDELVQYKCLRRIYTDPITNRSDWVIITGQGGIIGVHSRSEKTSLKILDGKRKYSEWVFVYKPEEEKGKE